jgi:excinuclease UvrABC nuclease subunit
MVDLIPERKGIYLFILPDLKVGYVGSSNNLKDVIYSIQKGKEEIN